MKKMFKGIICCVITAALLLSTQGCSKSEYEDIQAMYDNFIDQFSDTATDTSNSGDETADDADETDITEEAVDEANQDGTYLLDVCPPYETSKYEAFVQNEGRRFQMAGKDYSNGFTIGWNNDNSSGYAIFNLDSRYSAINFTIGHIDGKRMRDTTVYFYLDDKLIKEVSVEAEALPQIVSLPVTNGLKLKIHVVMSKEGSVTGFGNVTVQ